MRFQFLISSLIIISTCGAQSLKNNNSNTIEHPIIGILGPVHDTIIKFFPILTDYEWNYYNNLSKQNPLLVIKNPLLILNGLAIRCDNQVNNFRMNIDKYKIIKVKYYNYSQAKNKFKIQNIPEDGILFVDTNKKTIVDIWQ